jgi:hypothetical protein
LSESTLLDAWVLAMFGVTAASLAAIGLFAMMSAIVRQHEHEIAIRMALGATPSGIRASLMWRGLALSAAGLVLGTAGGIAAPGVITCDRLAERCARYFIGVRPPRPLPSLASVNRQHRAESPIRASTRD